MLGHRLATGLLLAQGFNYIINNANFPGGVQAVFLMNPTKVAQVKSVADIGEVMPQKSTFFYPKIASGLAMNPIDPAEEVDRA